MTIRDLNERIEWWAKEGKKEMDQLVGKPNIENMLHMIDDMEYYLEKYGLGKKERTKLLRDKMNELKRSLKNETTFISNNGGNKNNV
jgi:hypothetical protein